MIWKALADPTRRTILDMLRQAPRTTGELSRAFKSKNLSRYAVMKHLTVLEKADLIFWRKEGKFRWNYLNSRPFEQAYQEGVGQIIQLKYYTEAPDVLMDKKVNSTIINIELSINAPLLKVWQAFTQDIGEWWPVALLTNPNSKKMVLEAKLGGLLYEEVGNGQGYVWANVIGLELPSQLQLKGLLSPDFGGPAISFLSFRFEDQDTQTALQLQDHLFGVIAEDTEIGLRERWGQLLEGAFKGYVESA